MNETIQTLLTRRSVRKYQNIQIKENDLNLILKAGCYAPTGMGDQPWHFVAIQNPEVRARLLDVCKATTANDGDPFYGAPTIVLVFVNMEACQPVKDGALAIGNMANAAASLGLGSCWINIENEYFETETGAAFKNEILPDARFQSIGSLAVGYADEEPAPKPRREGMITLIK